jgi:hypothetical protein
MINVVDCHLLDILAQRDVRNEGKGFRHGSGFGICFASRARTLVPRPIELNFFFL